MLAILPGLEQIKRTSQELIASHQQYVRGCELLKAVREGREKWADPPDVVAERLAQENKWIQTLGGQLGACRSQAGGVLQVCGLRSLWSAVSVVSSVLLFFCSFVLLFCSSVLLFFCATCASECVKQIHAAREELHMISSEAC